MHAFDRLLMLPFFFNQSSTGMHDRAQLHHAKKGGVFKEPLKAASVLSWGYLRSSSCLVGTVFVGASVWKYTHDKRFKRAQNKYERHSVCESTESECAHPWICKSGVTFLREGGRKPERNGWLACLEPCSYIRASYRDSHTLAFHSSFQLTLTVNPCFFLLTFGWTQKAVFGVIILTIKMR